MANTGNYWTDFNRRRASRRNVLRGAALGAGGLGTMALVGCGGDDDDDNGNGGGANTPTQAPGTTPGATSGPTGPVGNTTGIDVSLEEFREIYHGRELKKLPGASKQPQRGGQFNFSMIRPVSWDPTGAGAATLPSYVLMHNQLLKFQYGDNLENHNKTEIEADVAQSMPEQPDDLTFTFKLNPEVRFHDVDPVNGRALTSEDVKYAAEVYADSPTQSSAYSDVASIDTPDAETVVFKMKNPAAYFLGSIVVPYHWLFSPEQHQQSPDQMATTPIGTGPFLLESMTDQAGFTVVRNPNYWRKDSYGTQLPYFDKVVYDWIPSPVDGDAAFRTGQLDHRYPANYDAWKDLVSSNPEVVTQVTTPPPSAQPFIVMNLTKEPFNDVRVRRALSLAIDRDAMIDALAGGMAGYGYGMDQTYFGSEWPLEQEELGNWHHFDLEQAKQLLAEAGYPNGDGLPTLEVFTSTTAGLWFEIFVAVFNMWNQLGVQVEHGYSPDQAQWQGQYFGKNYNDMMGVTLVGPGFDPDPYTYQALHSESARNYFHVNNPDLDRLTLESRREMDPNRRVDLLRDIIDIDLDEVYRIWLIMTYKINIRYPHVQNLTDVHAAWSPVGWGSQNLEVGWFDEDQRA